MHITEWKFENFFCHTDFLWNHSWRIYILKICHFNTFRGSELWFSCIFAFFEGWYLSNYLTKIKIIWNGKSSSFRNTKFFKIDFTQNLSDKKILKLPQCPLFFHLFFFFATFSPLCVEAVKLHLHGKSKVQIAKSYVWVWLYGVCMHHRMWRLRLATNNAILYEVVGKEVSLRKRKL